MLFERLCSKCGKNFIPAPEHMYRSVHGGKMYCSYTCWIHADDAVKKKPGYAPKMVEQYSLDGEPIRIFESADQAAEFIGSSKSHMQRTCRVGGEFKGYIWKYQKGDK